MKRLFFSLAALAAITVGNAQQHPKQHFQHRDDDIIALEMVRLLPKKGDLATGVDVAGMVKFIGNSISDQKMEGDAVSPLGGDFFAKYFLTDKIALRAHVGVGASNYTRRRFVRDDVKVELYEEYDARTTDIEQHRSSSFMLGLGAEYRRGLRRVQGYAGAEVILQCYSQNTQYEYGNAITSSNRTPSYVLGYQNYSGERDLRRSSKSFSGGLTLFTGVDYFFSRNVSLGFEFSLSGLATRTKAQKHSFEVWDTELDEYRKTEEDSMPKQGDFSINPAAGANLMFYF
jgi:hypothetical protein